ACAFEYVAQQADATFGRGGVIAQQDAKPRLRVDDAGKPEQLVFDLVDPLLEFRDLQQRLPRYVLYCVDEVAVGRPALPDRSAHQVKRGVADLASQYAF